MKINLIEFLLILLKMPMSQLIEILNKKPKYEGKIDIDILEQ